MHEIKTSVGREMLVSEFARVLKPQGTLYVTDAFSKFQFFSLASRILQHLTSRVEWHFPESQLEKILLKNNFEIMWKKEIDPNTRKGTTIYVVCSRRL